MKTPTISLAEPNAPRFHMMPSLPRNLTSCSPIRPMEKAGRETSNAWAAKTGCEIPVSISGMAAMQNIPCYPFQRRPDAFLANMVSKMNHKTHWAAGLPRYIMVHRFSPVMPARGEQYSPMDDRERLAGSIVALPLNMFYNTGIATYIWVLTNRKASIDGQSAAHRCHPMVHAIAQKPRAKRTANSRRKTSADLRYLS